MCSDRAASRTHLRDACCERLQNVVDSMSHLHSPWLANNYKVWSIGDDSGLPVDCGCLREALGSHVYSEEPCSRHMHVLIEQTPRVVILGLHTVT